MSTAIAPPDGPYALTTDEKAREALAQTVDSAGTWEVDPSSGELRVSARIYSLWEIPPGAPVTVGLLLSRVHPDDREGLDQPLYRTGGARAFRILLAGGAVRWLIGSAAVIRDACGTPFRVVGVAHDVTRLWEREGLLMHCNETLERHLADKTRSLLDTTRQLAIETSRREEAETALRHAEKLLAVGQMTSGVVHDLKNVLQPIVYGFDVLESRIQDPKMLRFVAMGQRSVKLATSLLHSLLGFVHRETSELTVVNPTALMGEIQELLRYALHTTTTCSFEVEEGVWSVRVEVQRLQAALLNLAVNARDALDRGGEVVVRVHNVPQDAPKPSTLPSGEYVAFSVRDTGSGMTPEVLARATEPFFTTKGTERGTGLGLAMVHGFATESGGALRITSAPMQGTLVEILLPRVVPPLAPPVPQEVASPSSLRLREPTYDRMMKRLRTDALRRAYVTWLRQRGASRLPRMTSLKEALSEHTACTFIAAVEVSNAPVTFRCISCGVTLAAMLGRSLVGEGFSEEVGHAGDNIIGTLEGAYQRAIRSGHPSYEYARYMLGDEPPTTFERLLLPASEDGQAVSHIVGIIAMTHVALFAQANKEP